MKADDTQYVDEHLVGYVRPLSAAPRDMVDVMVSTSASKYTTHLVRVVGREGHDGSYQVKETRVAADLPTVVNGRRQHARMGSCISVPDMRDVLATLDRWVVDCWIKPSRRVPKGEQAIVSALCDMADVGWELQIDGSNRFVLLLRADGDTERFQSTAVLRADEWYHVLAAYDGGRQKAAVAIRSRQSLGQAVVRCEHARGPVNAASDEVMIGARPATCGGASTTYAACHYDGRVGEVRIHRGFCTEPDHLDEPGSRDVDLVAHWDLSAEMASDRIKDIGLHHKNGVAINHPSRAIRGRRWTGEYLDFRLKPDHYAAVHFHSEHLSDAEWEPDVTFAVPEGLRTGVYAVVLESEDMKDRVPFVVRPGDTESSRVVVVLPTLTYQAYANSRVALEREFGNSGVVGRQTTTDPSWALLRNHPEWGRSLYDVYSDDSGCFFSSNARPMLNMRPDYLHWVTGAPRHLSSDLCLLHWLERSALAFDVLTDQDLHAGGTSALASYEVLITGSHPEYATSEMLDALEQFIGGGGRLMYMGGNGYYWVTSVTGDDHEVMEVRRGRSGTRPWTSQPGESHLASTGEPGGLWRERGRPPNALTGVGFTAQGWDERASPYVRTRTSYDAHYRWIFEGVAQPWFGDSGLSMGGAAGDEIDRHDNLCGSPADAMVLASSCFHSDHYCVAIEDLTQTAPDITASRDQRVRADMVLRVLASGGAVWSTGSMCWVPSLCVNDCDNDVSRITANVLHRFCDPRPLPASSSK
jgi:N,N-dimethylformamidase